MDTYEKELLEKIDKNELLTERELKSLVFEYSIKDIEHDYGRWLAYMTTIVEIDGRYFSINWNQGLTEMQENEFYEQPKEVKKIEYITTIKNEDYINININEQDYINEKSKDSIINNEKISAIEVLTWLMQFEKMDDYSRTITFGCDNLEYIFNNFTPQEIIDKIIESKTNEYQNITEELSAELNKEIIVDDKESFAQAMRINQYIQKINENYIRNQEEDISLD